MDEILAGKYISDERIPGVREYSLLLQVMRLLNIPMDKVTERLKKLLNEDSGSTIVD